MPEKDVNAILKLEVPVIVRLAHKKMKLSEVLNLQHGSMVDLPKMADEPLDLMVNNKLVGHGSAVKVGENFGLKISVVGDAAERIKALGPGGDEEPAAAAEDDTPSDDELAAQMSAMLDGQTGASDDDQADVDAAGTDDLPDMGDALTDTDEARSEGGDSDER